MPCSRSLERSLQQRQRRDAIATGCSLAGFPGFSLRLPGAASCARTPKNTRSLRNFPLSRRRERGSGVYLDENSLVSPGDNLENSFVDRERDRAFRELRWTSFTVFYFLSRFCVSVVCVCMRVCMCWRRAFLRFFFLNRETEIFYPGEKDVG